MTLQTEISSYNAVPPCKTVLDAELVERVRAGEVHAYELIMRRHNQRLYRIARSIIKEDHEAMDVVQDAYVKAYYQLASFRGPEGFASWLSKITANEALTRLRKAKRLDYTIDDADTGEVAMQSDEPGPDDVVANQQLSGLLQEAIDKLPVEYRCVYVMRAVQQLDTRETAVSLEITEDAVKTRFKRAKQKLQDILQKHIDKAELQVFEFAGKRCDAIVNNVMARIDNKSE